MQTIVSPYESEGWKEFIALLGLYGKDETMSLFLNSYFLITSQRLFLCIFTFLSIFYFEMISDLQKNFKNDTNNSSISFLYSPVILPTFIILFLYVHIYTFFSKPCESKLQT